MLATTIRRVRRNHGLEHATIHMLSTRKQKFSAQGNSDHRGFNLNIYGDVSDEDVAKAAREALRRMRNVEADLAVHPNCGTVLLTTAAMAALAAQVVFGIEQKRQRRSAFSPLVLFNALPTAVLAVVGALILSKPVGLAIQEKYTTDGDPGDLEIVQIRRVEPSPVTRLFQLLLTPGQSLTVNAYRIDTSGG